MEQLRTMTVGNFKRTRSKIGRAKKIKIKGKEEEESKEITTDNVDKESLTNNETEDKTPDENDILVEIPTNKPFVFSYYGKFILIGTSGQ